MTFFRLAWIIMIVLSVSGCGTDAASGDNNQTKTTVSGTDNNGTISHDNNGTGSSTDSNETNAHDDNSTGGAADSNGTTQDTQAPTITLEGRSELYLMVGDEALGKGDYELGAQAYDETDGNLTAKILVNSDVNTATPGDYTMNYRVKDAAGHWSETNRTIHVVDRVGVFLFYDKQHGEEPWITDGTPNGTHRIEDTNTKPQYGSFSYGSQAFYKPEDTAYFSYQGDLWGTQGTPQTTRRVLPLNPHASARTSIVSTEGHMVYFEADDGLHGYQMWQSDGTEAGTKMTGIAREYYRAKSYYHTNLIAYQVQLDRLDRSKGVKLWLSDGTRDHTFVLDDKINYNYGGTKTIEKDSKVYFVNNGRLIESDGTPNGTHKHSYSIPLSSCSLIQGDKIYVNFSGEPRVLTLSNLSEEPQIIKDTQGNRVGGIPHLVGSKIYYLGYFGVWFQADANATPEKLSNDRISGSSWRQDALIAKYLIYTAKVDTDGDGEVDTNALVSLDTANGNQRTLLHDKDNHNLQFLYGYTIFGNKLFFRNTDKNNKGVWVTDGTQEGTIKLLGVSGSVYFSKKNDHIIISHYPRYWVTDGTKEGTKPIQKSNPILDYGIKVNGYWVHMTDSQEDWHHELWAQKLDDNTTNALVADPIGTQSMVRSTADKDRVELFGSTYYFGKNMYYDIGSQSIKRFNQVEYGMRRMTQVGKKIYFLDAEPYSWNKFSLCRINIDGTDFEKLDDNVLSYTLTLANVGEWVYFVRHGEDNERASLWKIKNGMAKPIRVLAQGQKKIAYPQELTSAGKFLYFLAKEADDNMAGIELWRTDGTVAGTYMLKDILPGSRSAFLSYLDYGRHILNSAAVGDKLYFRAYDGNADKNVSIWVTNGTKSGTKKISNSSFKEAYTFSYVFFVSMAQGTYATLPDDRLLWIDNADDTLHDTLPPSADSGSARRRHTTQNIVIGDRMYFLHNDGNGTDWWYARNGVAKAVKDTNGNRPKITDKMWKKAFAFDDAVYYISDDSEKGDVLKRFKPDGNGTYQIKEVYDGAEDGPYRGLYYWKAGVFDGKLLSGFGHPAALYLIDQNLSKVKLAEDQD